MYSGESGKAAAKWFQPEPLRIEPHDELQIEIAIWNGEELVIGEKRDEFPDPQIKVKVNPNGTARLPLVGVQQLGNLTLNQSDSLLIEVFSNYIKDPYVKVSFLNKKVSVIGAATTQVIPIEDESMKLSQVIALSGGIMSQSRSNNIKIIRGEEYFIADLSKLESGIKNDIPIKPGDVIYIEPVRRPFGESLREITPAISIITSIITLAALLITIL